MRKLINNFRHKCIKLILDGKDMDINLNPKQQEDLQESMHIEEYMEKSTKGKEARDDAKD